MNVHVRGLVLAIILGGMLWGCRQSAPAPQLPESSPEAAAAAEDDPGPADENLPVPNIRTAEVLRTLLPSNGTGCAPGSRCIRVTQAGRPSTTGASVAQCRGEMADYIVPSNSIPAGYGGPWFAPNLIEHAHTGVPSGTRPWRQFDPRVESQRLPYLLALRNYAFASAPVRNLTPTLAGDSDYRDPAGGTVPTAQRVQSWYPAPRMIYGNPNQPGVREAAHGMTLERTVIVNELGGNTAPFRNYAVAYYDARGARTYARVWNTATAGVDTPQRAQMRITTGSLVYKLLFSAARPTDWPQDLLAGSLGVNILPNAGGTPITVRLLQIDIAVKDNRAGTTGWYFATYVYDRSAVATSPWMKMVPLGLMWGNDPGGPPLQESWINPAAPAYAKAHLGVDGRLNGPVDNRASACMSCHSTAQAPSVAGMLPTGSCAAQRASWFRNLSGTQPFGRFDPRPTGCETSLSGTTLTAADYSLQLSATVNRAISTTAPATFNPCTWDADASPSEPPAAPTARTAAPDVTVFEVTRAPEQEQQ